MGKAPTAATVTVNEEQADRQGEYWHREVSEIDNSSGAAYEKVVVHAIQVGAAAGGGDLETLRIADQFVPPLLETPVYDEDGNLQADARWDYVWNGENRLIELTTGPGALLAGAPKERYRYDYDSRGRRIRQRKDNWDTGTAAWQEVINERYIYEDWNLTAVVDAAGVSKQRFMWGTDLSGTAQGAGGVGGLLAASDSGIGRAWCYAYDGNGNVHAVVDVATGESGSYEYDAFGQTIASWGDAQLTNANAVRFSTKWTDGTELVYYGFRYYMPTTGRWASRDPIEEDGGVNLYGFVSNSPSTSVDYLGLDKHHWMERMGEKTKGQAAVDECTLRRCLCDIDFYTTEIAGQAPHPHLPGKFSWGGSPHEILHNKLKYNHFYGIVRSATKGKPCAFWGTMTSMMKVYDQLLEDYGQIVGYSNGAHTATGPKLEQFTKKGTDTTSSWYIEGFGKCCKKRPYRGRVFERRIEKDLIRVYEQLVLRETLNPNHVFEQTQRHQNLFPDPNSLYPERVPDEVVVPIIIVSAFLTPIPGDEYAITAAVAHHGLRGAANAGRARNIVGTVHAEKIRKLKQSVEGAFGVGKSNIKGVLK